MIFVVGCLCCSLSAAGTINENENLQDRVFDIDSVNVEDGSPLGFLEDVMYTVINDVLHIELPNNSALLDELIAINLYNEKQDNYIANHSDVVIVYYKNMPLKGDIKHFNRTLHGRSKYRQGYSHHHNIFYKPGQGDAIDLFVDVGTPLLAVGDGRVIKKSYSPARAEHFMIEGDNFHAVYAHCRLRQGLNVGDSVKTGQIIGYVTNRISNPHLHFEFSWNSVPVAAPTAQGFYDKYVDIFNNTDPDQLDVYYDGRYIITLDMDDEEVFLNNHFLTFVDDKQITIDSFYEKMIIENKKST